MSHPSVARSLVLETTLFPEDVSLDRLQALLDQWQAAGVEIIQGFPTTDGSTAGEKGDHTT